MNDDREPRDPALDALLAEHSTETPPAHIDAAILAAAHRAVASGPRPALATQAWRWWMPLAAAAVIGLVVVGVLPLAPSIVTESPPTVTDVPASALGARPDSFRIPDRPDKGAAELPSNAAPPLAARAEDRAVPRAAAKLIAPERKLERDRPVPAEPRKDRVLDAPPELQKHQAGAAGALGAAPESPTAPPSGNAVSPLARPAELAAPQRAPSASARDDFDARPHTADEWIARIRTLRNEGKLQEAIRALVGFRAAFNDADIRLPTDMREWANAQR